MLTVRKMKFATGIVLAVVLSTVGAFAKQDTLLKEEQAFWGRFLEGGSASITTPPTPPPQVVETGMYKRSYNTSITVLMRKSIKPMLFPFSIHVQNRLPLDLRPSPHFPAWLKLKLPVRPMMEPSAAN